MNSVGAVGVVGGDNTATRQLVDALLARGAHPAVIPPGKLEALVAAARTLGVGALITADEYLTADVAVAVAWLGLPGNDPRRALAARDKGTMASLLGEHGVRHPLTTRLEGPADARRYSAAATGPKYIVVKPAAGAGSQGVLVGRRADAVQLYLAASASLPLLPEPARRRGIVAQEYVSGDEYSVESVTVDGRTCHLAVVRKFTSTGTARIEVGHALATNLGGRARSALLDTTERALTALGMRHSVSHVELKFDRTGGPAVVIEVAARPAGGPIPMLIHRSGSINPVAALAALATGKEIEQPATLARPSAAWAILATAAGPVRDIDVPALPPGIDVQLTRPPGSTVRDVASNNARVGWVFAGGAGPEEAVVAARRIASRCVVR